MAHNALRARQVSRGGRAAPRTTFADMIFDINDISVLREVYNLIGFISFGCFLVVGFSLFYWLSIIGIGIRLFKPYMLLSIE